MSGGSDAGPAATSGLFCFQGRWSGQRESNPHEKLGKLSGYHYIMPAEPGGNLADCARRSRADAAGSDFFTPVTVAPLSEVLLSKRRKAFEAKI
jgi:hypothetical protein